MDKIHRIIVYIDAKIIEAAKKVGEQLYIPVEAKKISKQHYRYKDTTKWDREKRKRIKASEYLVKINENGLMVKNSQSIHEFGSSELVLGYWMAYYPGKDGVMGRSN
jgi:hypothetical protein